MAREDFRDRGEDVRVADPPSRKARTATSLAAFRTAGALSPAASAARASWTAGKRRLSSGRNSSVPSSASARRGNSFDPALGKGERILDREDHVVDRELRQPGAVAELDHRVHQGARMHDDVDRVGRTPNRCDASMSSSPLLIRVEESMLILAPIDQVGWRSASSLPDGPKVAGSRCRNGPPEAVRTSRRTSARVPAAQRLVERHVLAVDRHDLGAVGVREVGQQAAGDDQRLLVGQGDRLARGERRGDRREARGPDDRRHDLVDFGVGGGGDEGLGPGGDLDAGRQLRAGARGPPPGRRRRRAAGETPAPARAALRDSFPGRRASNGEPLGMMPDDLDRGVADRAGGAEKREPLDHRTSSTPAIQSARSMTGAARNMASKRSNMPPCPGRMAPESLTFAARLTSDSTRSPSWLAIAVTRPTASSAGSIAPLPPERPDGRRGERRREAGDRALPRLLRRHDRRQPVFPPGRADVVSRCIAEPDDGEQEEEDPRVALLEQDETRDRSGEVEGAPAEDRRGRDRLLDRRAGEQRPPRAARSRPRREQQQPVRIECRAAGQAGASARSIATAASGALTSRSFQGACGASGRTMERNSMAAHSKTTRSRRRKAHSGKRKTASSAAGTPIAAVRRRFIDRSGALGLSSGSSGARSRRPAPGTRPPARRLRCRLPARCRRSGVRGSGRRRSPPAGAAAGNPARASE
jgi:hypothetical protein